MTKKIVLDFGKFAMDAELFDTPVADSFYRSLPQTISLVHWGKEMYGSVHGSHGSHQPVSEIPMGGLAYTARGSYFCIFYGQSPAWPVEHIGRISATDLSALGSSGLGAVTVKSGDE